MHNGPFRKYVTVISNAKNSPSMRLSLGGTIKSDINYTPGYIRMMAKPGDQWSEEIVLSTNKKDFKVTEIAFKPADSRPNGPEWQASMPIFIDHKVTKSDSINADGYIDYRVTLSISFKETETKHGEFVIKTNHPKKGELKIPGMIEGRKN